MSSVAAPTWTPTLGESVVDLGLCDADEAASRRSSSAPPMLERGQGETVTALIQRELPKLRRLAMMLVRDNGQANDLIQDTIVRALTYAHHWQAGTNFGAWVRTIMRNQFFSGCVRRTREMKTVVPGDGYEASIAPAQEQRLLCHELASAIGRLPPMQRLVLSFLVFEDMSAEEIAPRMNISVNAVRCHLMRGRKQLRADSLGNSLTRHHEDALCSTAH